MIKVLLTACLILGFQTTHAQLELKPYFNAVVVKDIDASIPWYAKVFNVKVGSRNENPERGSIIVVMESRQMMIELIQVRSTVAASEVLADKPPRTLLLGFTKIGFRSSDLNMTIKHLKDQNVDFFGDIYTDSTSGKRSFLVKDPDGT